MRVRLFPLLLLWLSAFAPPAAAIRPDRPLDQLLQDAWIDADGLPQLTVVAIAQDRTGYLWVGTQSGLARFDGVRFKVYTPSTDPALPGIDMRSLLALPDGSLLVGTYRGLALHRDGRLHAVPRPGDVAPRAQFEIRQLLACGGTVWVAASTGLYVYAQGRLQRRDGIDTPTALACADSGLLVANAAGIRSLQPSARTLPALPDGLIAQALAQHADRVWAGTRQGLYVLDAGAWRAVSGHDLGATPIAALRQDSQGTLWVAAANCLGRIRDGALIDTLRLGTEPGMRDMRSIAEDREGNLWVGSQLGGLIRLNDRSVTDHPLDMPQKPIVWSVVPARQPGQAWVGTSDGVFLFGPQGYRRVVPGAALPDPNASNLFLEGDRLWIGTRAGPVHIDTPEGAAPRVRTEPALAPLRTQRTNAFVRMDDGSLWLGMTEGAYRLDTTGRLFEYGAANGLPKSDVTYLLRTRSGRLIAGRSAGAYRYDPATDRFQRILLGDRRQPFDVTAIGELPSGTLVYGTMTGELVVAGRRLRRIALPAELAGGAVFRLQPIGDWLWISLVDGIARVPIAAVEADAAADDRVTAERVIATPPHAHGRRETDCCNGKGTAKGMAMDGRLWLPGRSGLVSLRTEDVRRNTTPPIPVIETVSRNGRDSLRIETAEGEQASGVRDFAFTYTLLALYDPHGKRVEYRLEGYDGDWQTAPPGANSVQYTNLPPGDYRFVVRGWNADGTASRGVAAYRFGVTPYYHETPAFWLLLAGGSLLLMTLAVRYKGVQLRRQNQRLEELVAERTRALENANRQLADASLTDPLTGLRNRRHIGDQLAADMAFYRRQLQKPAHQDDVILVCLIDIDHFKQINDLHGHAAGDAVLREFARRLPRAVRPEDYIARWGGEEFLLVYRPMQRDHVAGVAGNLLQALTAAPYDIGNHHPLRITCSIGIAPFPLIDGDWETLVHMADMALYHVKQHGRDGWAAYEPTSEHVRFDTSSSREALAEALAAGRVRIVGSVPSG